MTTMTRERREIAIAMAPNFTAPEIGAWIGCTENTVLACLKRFGVPALGGPAYFLREKEFLMRAFGIQDRVAALDPLWLWLLAGCPCGSRSARRAIQVALERRGQQF